MSNCICCFGQCVFVYDVDESNWHDIVYFVRAIFRLYCFMLLLAAIDLMTVPYDNDETLSFAVVQLALYIPVTTALMYVSRKPSLKNTMYTMIAVGLLCIYNILYAIYIGVKYKDWWALIHIVPVTIQLSTIYVMFKIRQKLVRLGVPLDYSKLEEQGDETTSYRSPLVPNSNNPVDRESMY